MKKVMCDTNVILDVLLEREPFADDSARILIQCEERKLHGFISAASITDIFYFVKKYTHSTADAYHAIGKVLDIVKVCSVTNDDVLTAYQTGARDFEDCLLATCAKSIRCSCIITRNPKDFKDFGLPVFTPHEFIEKYLSPLS